MSSFVVLAQMQRKQRARSGKVATRKPVRELTREFFDEDVDRVGESDQTEDFSSSHGIKIFRGRVRSLKRKPSLALRSARQSERGDIPT